MLRTTDLGSGSIMEEQREREKPPNVPALVVSKAHSAVLPEPPQPSVRRHPKPIVAVPADQPQRLRAGIAVLTGQPRANRVALMQLL
jgi:hypothetical protein